MYAKNVNINPCNMCMPMGGILAFKGLEKSMVIVHGSQGCSTYMRRHISEHYHEPIDVASTSLNEKGTVYGGEENLKKGLDHLIQVYNPKLIGVVTTCLAETIGEDIERLTFAYMQEKKTKHIEIVPVSTPGYGGSHTEGYYEVLKTIVKQLAQQTKKNEKIAVIIPHISPADIREIKRILEAFAINYVLLPDFSKTLDGPYTKSYSKINKQGTKINDIKELGGASAIIEFSLTLDDNLSPGKYLEDQFGVPLYRLPLPIGIENTDEFFKVLQDLTGKDIPPVFKEERGRLLDCMIDSHKYNSQGKAVVIGEPELLYGMVSACNENGIDVKVAATGSQKNKVVNLIEEQKQQISVLKEADFSTIFREIADKEINIALGHSDGRCLTERKGIPLVRMGFPVHDRVGGGRIQSVGYIGTIQFLDRITNTLLENKYKKYRASITNKFFEPIKNC